MKEWHRSETIQSGLLTIILSLTVACSQPVQDLICRGAGPDSRLCRDTRDYVSILVSIAGVMGIGTGIGAVHGRLRVGDVFTPHGLPGPNKEDLESKYLESVADVFVDSLPLPEGYEVPEPEEQGFSLKKLFKGWRG